MFSCTTEFICDVCGTGFRSQSNRMSECMSKAWFRMLYGKEGWKTVYGKYDICPNCVKHYGMKYIRNKFRERENNG